MSRVAKTGDVAGRPPLLRRGADLRGRVAWSRICVVLPLIGAGAEMRALREGFTEFLFTPGRCSAFLIGLLLLGPLRLRHADLPRPARVHLGVPVNRCSSVLSVVGRLVRARLAVGIDTPAPGDPDRDRVRPAGDRRAQLPAAAAARRRRRPRSRRAAWCCSSAAATPAARRSPRRCPAPSSRAGTGREPRTSTRPAPASASTLAGSADGAEAAAALRELGVAPHPHGSQPLTASSASRRRRSICMTERAAAGRARARARRVAAGPSGSIPTPTWPSPSTARRRRGSSFAARVRELVRERLADLPPVSRSADAGVAGDGRDSIVRDRTSLRRARSGGRGRGRDLGDPDRGARCARAGAVSSGIARYLEVRADLAGDLDPRGLRERFEGGLVYSLRSAERGGEAEMPVAERRRRLLAAAERYDLVDLELDSDLDSRPARPDPARAATDLLARSGRRASASSRTGSRGWPRSRRGSTCSPRRRPTVADGLAPLQLLAELGRYGRHRLRHGPRRDLEPASSRRDSARAVDLRPAREGPGPACRERRPAQLRLRPADDGPTARPLRDRRRLGRRARSRRGSSTRVSRARASRPSACPSHRRLRRLLDELVERGLPRSASAARPDRRHARTRRRRSRAATYHRPAPASAGAANSLVRAGHGWHGREHDPDRSTCSDRRASTRPACGPRSSAAAAPGRSVAAELAAHGADVTLVNRGDSAGRLRERAARPALGAARRVRARGVRPGRQRDHRWRASSRSTSRSPERAVVADLAYRAAAPRRWSRRPRPRARRGRRQVGARRRDRLAVRADDRTADAAGRG